MDVEGARLSSSGLSFSEYMRRLFNYKQMDIEATFWLMFQLCVNPKSVYVCLLHLLTQTKHHWARDDPAFVAILLINLFISSISYAVAFNEDGLAHILRLVFWTIVVDFLLVGVVLSTFAWFLANNYLRNKSATTDAVGEIHTPPAVEWLYAFDIHCNSFFPLYLILYVLQYILILVLYKTSWISLFLSNTLYIVALGYYYYITFLGYTSLKFLQNTQWIIVPFIFCIFLYILSVFVLPLFGIYFNATIFVLNFYFG